MTPAQLTTLNALATADQTALGYIDTADDQSLADWLNTVDASFYVYRSVLTPAMARSAIIQGATQLDGLTVGKRDSLFYLASGDLAVSKAGVRAALDDLCGTMNQLKGYIQEACKRTALPALKRHWSRQASVATPALQCFLAMKASCRRLMRHK